MFTFTLQYAEAMKIVKKLAHSMSSEETRYYLNGIFIHKDGDRHYAVSTDAHRLTRLEINPAYTGEFPAFILPKLFVKQLLAFKLASGRKNKATVEIQVDPKIHHYEMACEGQGASGGLINGTYPSYQHIIPANFAEYRNEYGEFGFNPAYLAEICEAAAYDAELFKAEKHPAGVRLFFDGSNTAVVVEKDPRVLYVIMPMRVSLPEHRHAAEAEPSVAA